MYLQHVGLGPYVYHTDCAWVLTTWQGGREHSTGAQHVHAGLWRRIFDKADEMGPVSIVKVKAHATLTAVRDGHADPWHKAGNDYADAGAKRGAQGHPRCEAADKRCEQSFKVVTLLAKYLARLAVWLAEAGSHDVTPKSQRLHRERRAGYGRRFVKPTAHALCRHGDRWRCARCHRSAASAAPLLATVCARPVGHRLYQAGGLLYCACCGAYSRFRARGLLRSCRGGASAAAVKALGLIRARICPATGTALPQPVHFGLEQFDQHMAGLLQILESPGDDSG